MWIDDGDPTAVAAEDPITVMYRLCAPHQPVFQWLQLCGGQFRCEYRMGESVGAGAGATKKVAKTVAAMELARQLANRAST